MCYIFDEADEPTSEEVTRMFEDQMDMEEEAMWDQFEKDPGVECRQDIDDVLFGTDPF